MFRFIPVEEEECIKWTLSGKLHDNYRKMSNNFNEKYQLCNILVNIPYLLQPLKKKQERRCMFCGLSYPTVKFNKIAHKIPELIGNQKLLSDSECDDCNRKFSALENDLAYSLGMMRSLLQIDTKVGIPTFKAPSKDFEVREGLLRGEKVVVFESIGKKVKNFNVDKERKIFSINTTKQSYRPFNVFKILVKIAVSTLSLEELEKFRLALDLIIGKTDIKTLSNDIFQAFVYFVPGITFPSPMVLLYKKKIPETPLVTYTACIYFMNYIYQVFLPGYIDDIKMFDGEKKFDFHIAPPLIDEATIKKFGFPSQFRLDLFSKELVKGEKDNIQLSYDSNKHFSGDPFEEDLIIK